MRAQHEMLCDLAIAETARDAGEDLLLTTGQQDRLRLARMVRRRLHRCQRFATRSDDGIDITVPGEVRAALQRDELRAWNRGRDLTPEPVRHGAVVATMHDQRRPADEGKLHAYVESIDETQQGGSGVGGRRLPLEPCEAFVLGSFGTSEEDVTEQARAESPMRVYRSEMASATSGAVIAAPSAYDPYSTRRSTRSGNAAANAMAVQLPLEPPMSVTRSSSSSSRSARSVATSPSMVRSDSRIVRSDMPTPSWS